MYGIAADTCPSCGQPLESHDRHVRFTLPDPVLNLTGWENEPGTWMSHGTARDSVMMQVPDIGAFVRALLPIHLAGGHTLTYGVWLAVDPSDLPHIFGMWWEPTYQDLRISGWLANPVPPWGMLAAPVDAIVRNPDHTPYCDHSDDPTLKQVLREEWPHDVAFRAQHQAAKLDAGQ
ncbi:DUF2199 domain-containing protein [Amycolatopsis cynarae]|uniref:DUF2199 domain-containing protein n=1 Tax=Amycolatopsis cynarae TaxID=2995223 RepID=A0ABY7B0T2_9PSEU|nr:DUF2199 domain-containing protein [Amycolatopsis sp. HUAS 11-8]WAL65906.1 DUF2199 domain-containing protein [Amycolatopsis sp. HUAS 11-8]